MKRAIYFLSLFACVLLVLSTTKLNETSKFVLMVANEEPVLPSEPYEYRNINFPAHLFTDDPIGYPSHIDTTTIAGINNDFATLGRVLFYDTKLSASENISCGSCHDQALSFAENTPFSEGVNSPTARNSLQLNDLGWTNHHHFGWNVGVTDLSELIILPLTDPNEIGVTDLDDLIVKLQATSYYAGLFDNATGSPIITEEKIIEALRQFIISMNTFNSRFDQAADVGFNTFTLSESLGQEIFQNSCGGCHFQGTFTLLGIPIIIDDVAVAAGLFNNGLPLDGVDLGAGDWDINLTGLFKPPTLRNIELTAPYMHDGRFETLEEVIDHYSEDVIENQYSNDFFPIENMNFTDQEKIDLKAFLLTLTDESFKTNPKWSDPFQPISGTNQLEIERVVLKPNPMQHTAIIEFQNDGNKKVEVSILNGAGKVLKQENITSNQYVIDRTNYPSGIYFVHLKLGEKRSIQKLVIQ